MLVLHRPFRRDPCPPTAPAYRQVTKAFYHIMQQTFTGTLNVSALHWRSQGEQLDCPLTNVLARTETTSAGLISVMWPGTLAFPLLPFRAPSTGSLPSTSNSRSGYGRPLRN